MVGSSGKSIFSKFRKNLFRKSEDTSKEENKDEDEDSISLTSDSKIVIENLNTKASDESIPKSTKNKLVIKNSTDKRTSIMTNDSLLTKKTSDESISFESLLTPTPSYEDEDENFEMLNEDLSESLISKSPSESIISRTHTNT